MVDDSSRVLITGAGGFIGRMLSEELQRRGVRVRCMLRRRPATLTCQEIAVIPDLASAPSDDLTRAVSGVATVIHLAGRVHADKATSTADVAEYQRVNVDGTRALLLASANAGVRCFVFVSSVKAVGEASGGSPWTESTVPSPHDAYGRSKRDAEEVVRNFATQAVIHAPILRLPLVYGPGVKANMLSLFRLVDRGLPLPFARLRAPRSLLYTGNLLAALLSVVATPAAGAETFFVSDNEDVAVAELVTRIGRALERRVRLVPVPVMGLRALGRFGHFLSGVHPALDLRGAIDRLASPLQVDVSKIMRVCGYSPPFSLDDGLRATAAWYRETAMSGS